jgi:hypothetical protein
MVSKEISQADLVGEKFGKLTEDYVLQSVIGEGSSLFWFLFHFV